MRGAVRLRLSQLHGKRTASDTARRLQLGTLGAVKRGGAGVCDQGGRGNRAKKVATFESGVSISITPISDSRASRLSHALEDEI
jgi:hypothetical protein